MWRRRRRRRCWRGGIRRWWWCWRRSGGLVVMVVVEARWGRERERVGEPTERERESFRTSTKDLGLLCMYCSLCFFCCCCYCMFLDVVWKGLYRCSFGWERKRTSMVIGRWLSVINLWRPILGCIWTFFGPKGSQTNWIGVLNFKEIKFQKFRMTVFFETLKTEIMMI